jgi:tetratricopeptide (TPR) repeat protein
MRGKDPKHEAGSWKPKAIGWGGLCVFALGLLVLWVCTFAGCESEESLQVKFASPEEKKAYLLRVVNRKFENPPAHFQLGKLYEAEGQLDKAEYHYNVALGFDPAYRAVQAALVKMLIDSGNSIEAKEYVDTYMKQVSGSAMATLELGQAFEQEGLDEHAFACYQRALSLGPELAEVNKQVGYYYLGKDDKVRAKEYLTRSFQVNPNQPDVAGELGRLGVVVKVPREPEEETENPEKGAG